MAKLFLIPNVITPDNTWAQLPDNITEVIKNIDYYIVEDIRTARRFIKSIYKEKNIDQVTFFELNKHTNETEIPSFLNPFSKGFDVGLISEAGVPCVADPGSVVVNIAHQNSIEVVPLVGPSSILLALMASGLNGQYFCFNGYLPIQRNERVQKLKALEKEVNLKGQTQIFIETPYRNNSILQDIINVCHENTKLCIASEIISDKAFIKTKSIKDWKNQKVDLHKQTVVFLLGR